MQFPLFCLKEFFSITKILFIQRNESESGEVAEYFVLKQNSPGRPWLPLWSIEIIGDIEASKILST